jgi:hypothetical protein
MTQYAITAKGRKFVVKLEQECDDLMMSHTQFIEFLKTSDRRDEAVLFAMGEASGMLRPETVN